jgi:alpha-ketoglutarate-dependent taurine dioxygenase
VEKRAGDADIFNGRIRLAGSHLMNPPKTILNQNSRSSTSIDLIFASLTQAWRGLSDAMQKILEGLSATHCARSEFGPDSVDPRRFSGQASSPLIYSDAIYESVKHPLVHIHQESGEKSLYVDEAFTSGIDGMHNDEGRALLDFLVRHCAKPGYGCRVVSRPGTLVMWDARSVTFMTPTLNKQHTRLSYLLTLASEEGFRRANDPPAEHGLKN